MENQRRKGFIHPLLVFFVLLSSQLSAQCPQAFDFFGNASDNPYWYSCSGADYDFILQSPDNWGSYEIDWGDGTPATTGASWTSPTPINHTYAAAVDTFIVTMTEFDSGCVLEGVVVMEEGTSASIQIPVGGLTQACAPQELEFINSSTNVSETTVFVWDFGDGSPPITFDYTNIGETVAHIYEPNTVDCETEVSLTAENYCNTIQGGASEATFNPIRIWDVDEAAITASATVLCYPDTVVDLTNTTERNCLFQGNIYQRYEYWNFGDYWGQGQDSLVDWTPWPPTFPYTIAYPGVGTYEVQMLDSNFCGIDTANITIEIVPPPIAGITNSEDTICVGEPITFFQGATGGANSYEWNFDDGNGWLPTGGGNITYIFNNPGTYNVCSAVSIQGSSAGCADTACAPITVLPSPVAIIGTDNSAGCDALTVNYEDLSIDAVNSSWAFDVDPFSHDGSDPPPIDYDSPGTYITTLTVEGLNSCLDTDQALINVFNSPQVDFIANNVCEGVPAEFLDLSIADPGDQITSWVWDFGDSSQAFDQNPEHVYQSTGTFTVTLTVSTANCSASFSQDISVEPAPTPNISVMPSEGCAPLTVTFENNTVSANSHQWLFGDNNGSDEAEPTHTYFNFTPQDTVYQVVYTAFTAFGCGASDTLDVLVYPGAQASFTDNSTPPSCAPFDATFINTSTGATSYDWDFGDGAVSSDVNPTHLYENETGFLQQFTVELIAYADNGCHDTTYSNVTVYPTPNFEFDLSPDSGCAPLIVTMPFIQGINSYQWDFGDGSDINIFPTPTHIFENQSNDPIQYTVELVGISPFGCSDTTFSQVWVNPQPTAQFSADVNSGCSPLTVTFENLSIQADTYDWNYGGAGTSDNSDQFHSFTFENLSSEVIVFDVQMTAISDDGCIDTFTVPIQVFPQAVASFDDPGEGCAPYEVTFENTSADYENLTWDFGNGLTSINENPTTIFPGLPDSDTTYTVSLAVNTTLGCSAMASLDVVVHPSPNAGFTLSQEEGCHPAPADITNLSTGATSYLWDYGDNQSSSEDASVHQHTWSSTSATPIEYNVVLTAITDFGCEDQFNLPYTVFPEIVADASDVDSGCAPLQVTFSNQSLGANAGFEWNFGDGISSSQTNPAHTFVNTAYQDTTYQVELIATSIYGCVDTTYIPVEVLSTPLAVALIDTTMGCYPLEVTFQNASLGFDQVLWTYGSGETDDIQDEFHTYTYFNQTEDPLTYPVTLEVTSTSGCTDTDQLNIDVLPQLQAGFNVNSTGCSPLTANFTNTSIGALNYQWFFGDGDTHSISNPSHTYFNPTVMDSTFEAMLVAESYFGCYDTLIVPITVFGNPIADFTATPESQVFPDATIDITNNSAYGESAQLIWDWGNQDSEVSDDPGSYTYDSWGTFDISLIIDNGACNDTTIQTIEITAPAPIAEFSGSGIGCAPLTVSFTNESLYGASFFWEFGDGGTSTADSPVYTYFQPGIYDVTLTVFGFNPGETDVYTLEAAVEVYPSAVAAFAVTPDQVNVPGQPVYTVNLSQFSTNYEWNFGDGNTSNEENPVHFYQTPGVYSIQLIANNQYNCPDTLIRYDVVEARALGAIQFPSAFSPNLSDSNGGIYDPEGFSNDVFFPIHYGIETYELQIFNKWGEMLFESQDVNIGWDGYHKGELCKQDVYAWKAKVRFVDGQEIIESGDVTLLVK